MTLHDGAQMTVMLSPVIEARNYSVVSAGISFICISRNHGHHE